MTRGIVNAYMESVLIRHTKGIDIYLNNKHIAGVIPNTPPPATYPFMPKQNFIVYHWSPRSRRKSILKYGLVPGSISRCGQWRSKYICFSDSPSAAWGLSGALDGPQEWDMWMAWSRDIKLNQTSWHKNEFRAYHRVYKRQIWYVGSRSS